MQSLISKYSPLPILLLFCSLLLTSCLDNSTNSSQERQNILETAKNVTQGQNGDQVLTTFVDLLEDFDLDSTVANNAPLTVIAPTNEAFDMLSEDVFDSSDTAKGVDILRYHLIEQIVDLNQISDDSVENIASSQGEDIFLERVQGTPQDSLFINDGNLLGGIQASNGLIYVVDVVLFPDIYLNTVGLIAKRPQLNSLEEAIANTNLSDTLETESQSYTVFAPSDEALQDTTLTENDIRYHIIPERLNSTGLSTETYTTLSGEDLNVEVSGSTITINSDATVTEADIEGTNGVVHIIDSVLSPADSTSQ